VISAPWLSSRRPVIDVPDRPTDFNAPLLEADIGPAKADDLASSETRLCCGAQHGRDPHGAWPIGKQAREL